MTVDLAAVCTSVFWNEQMSLCALNLRAEPLPGFLDINKPWLQRDLIGQQEKAFDCHILCMLFIGNVMGSRGGGGRGAGVYWLST